jgi:quinate/shikimate dehydrogenase (NAD+)
MKTLRTGLIGAGIARSRFGDALGIMCADHGMRLQFKAIDSAGVEGFGFAATLTKCRDEGWHGVSVTHPFKPDAARLAGPAAPPEVHALGASNTLLFGPPMRAANTDYSGFMDAWRAVFAARTPGRVVIAGAGGVARAIAPALAALGAVRIDIYDPLDGLATDLAARTGPVANAVSRAEMPAAIRAADGLVNATPLGMTGHPGCAFAPEFIGAQHWVFDAVYTPVETEFLAHARAAGLAILSGFELFRFMAMRSFAAYTGQVPDRAKTLNALNQLKPLQETA